jgi:hypothetical protein
MIFSAEKIRGMTILIDSKKSPILIWLAIFSSSLFYEKKSILEVAKAQALCNSYPSLSL